MTEHTFKQGDKVILQKKLGVYTKIVHKVYKNGNFILEPKGTQYRQSGHCAGQYYGGVVHPYTEEKYLEFAAPIRVANCKTRIREEIEKYLQKETDLVSLIKIETILKEKNNGKA